MLKRILQLGSQKKKFGLSPGTAVFVGERKVENVQISVFDFDPTHYKEYTDLDWTSEYLNHPTSGIRWINICGLHNVDELEALANRFNLHALSLEDIVNTEQRPKLEEYNDYLFLVVRMLYFTEQGELMSEQVSLILQNDMVMTLQERPDDVFDMLRGRIRHGRGRVRRMQADYLLYTLLDSIVDHYYLVLETIIDRANALEEELYANPEESTLRRINELKAYALESRKAVWPLREVINNVLRDESGAICDEVKVFARDLYDHNIQILDTIEILRESLNTMSETYMSTMANKMNEVMKTLTIFATIFLPITFVAGIYGMNFANMPELQWAQGYYFALGIMAAIALGMVVYFKRKKWL